MTVSYQVLNEMLIQKEHEQPKEFQDVINLINREQGDPNICELMNYLAQKETQYATYSHS